jgi:hypothetical protein
VYLPHSIVAWGSELRFKRRIIILAFDFGSDSSASDWGVLVVENKSLDRHGYVLARHQQKQRA